MPQKMIYVAETDLPTFERAQEFAGGNLSAAIARAVRLFVRTEEARAEDIREVTVAVAGDPPRRQRFRGRLLARHREHTPADVLTVRIIYQTSKGNFAVYTKTIAHWSAYGEADWERWDWSTRDYRLDVYDSLAALQPYIPEALFDAASRKLHGEQPEVEVLDI